MPCTRLQRRLLSRSLSSLLLLPFLFKVLHRSKLDGSAAAKSLQSCPTLCDPIDGGPPGSAVLGFSRQEHWSGLPFLLQYMKVKSEVKLLSKCPTLRDPMDRRLPGSSFHGIFQARVLEWVAMDGSRSPPNSRRNTFLPWARDRSLGRGVTGL